MLNIFTVLLEFQNSVAQMYGLLTLLDFITLLYFFLVCCLTYVFELPYRKQLTAGSHALQEHLRTVTGFSLRYLARCPRRLSAQGKKFSPAEMRELCGSHKHLYSKIIARNDISSRIFSYGVKLVIPALSIALLCPIFMETSVLTPYVIIGSYLFGLVFQRYIYHSRRKIEAAVRREGMQLGSLDLYVRRQAK